VQVIEQACAKNPDKRFDSAERFGKLIRTFTIPTAGGGSASASSAAPGFRTEAHAGSAAHGSAGASVAALEEVAAGASQHLQPVASPVGTQTADGGGIRQRLRLPKALSNIPQPVLYAGISTIAAVLLISIGVWLARGASNSSVADAAPRAHAGDGSAATVLPPAPTVSGPDAVLNGSLEKQDANGNILGWFVHDRFKPFVEIKSEGGNHYLRLTNKDVAKTVFVDQKMNVDPHWKTVTVYVRMRAIDFKAGKKPAEDGRVAFSFKDSSGSRVGSWPPVPTVKSDSPWTERVVTADVPEGATSLYIQLAIFNATGTVDFDDIKVIPQESR